MLDFVFRRILDLEYAISEFMSDLRNETQYVRCSSGCVGGKQRCTLSEQYANVF